LLSARGLLEPTVSIPPPDWQLWGAKARGRVARRAATDYITGRSTSMRAEIETIVEEIKQSLELLRRHL